MAQTMKIVREEDVQKGLEFLRDSAEALSLAKQRAIKAEHMLKHTEALCFKMSEEKGADAKRADARTDKRYLNAAMEDAVASGELSKLYALREAASMLIEAWRSEQANYRAMKI